MGSFMSEVSDSSAGEQQGWQFDELPQGCECLDCFWSWCCWCCAWSQCPAGAAASWLDDCPGACRGMVAACTPWMGSPSATKTKKNLTRNLCIFFMLAVKLTKCKQQRILQVDKFVLEFNTTMLEKYFKFLGGKPKQDEPKPTTGKDAAQPVAPTLSLGDVVLPVETAPISPSSDERLIDTNKFQSEANVTSILSVETYGERVKADELSLRFIGRQPVLDRAQQIVGYDLVLRNRSARAPQRVDDALLGMQDEMLAKSILNLEIERLLGDKLAFFSFSHVMLNNPMLQKLPKEGAVLAFHAEASHVVAMTDGLVSLAQQGYVLALDDYVPQAGLEPLLPLVKYVRLDITKFDATQLSEAMSTVKQHASPQFVARNVQSDEDFEVCEKLAFEYFQGYYFAQMQPSQPTKLNNDKLRVMELLNLVTSHAEISALEAALKRDAALSYKLLRYINSPGCGLLTKIRSIAHALVMLGYDQLYRWLTLLLFTSGKLDVRSEALLKNALVRARMTELLGSKKQLPPQDQERLFIVGIFSLLDVLLNTSMDKALEIISLPDMVLNALVKREGIYAPYLKLAVACEGGEPESVAELAGELRLSVEDVNLAHVQAMIWAEDVGRD